MLVFFIAAMSFILLNAYKTGILQVTHERLHSQFYSILSVSDEIEAGELFIPEEPQVDQRFNQFGSGLIALVYDETETLIWSSISNDTGQAGENLALPISFPGQEYPLTEMVLNNETYFQFNYVTEWESAQSEVSLYHYVILENKRAFDQIIAAYRNKLWMWLIGLAASLMLILFLVLRWSLSPIRKAMKELRQVELGIEDKLSEQYPQEIRGLTDSINRFISNERHQSSRYKETLGNLAHSLKTPLAVMQAALQNDADKASLEKIYAEQLQRMDQIVAYQLQRATRGPQVMMRSISVAPAIEKLVKGLEKVYQHKNIQITHNVDKDLKVALNEGDLYEVCGNLMDNACKFAQQRVSVEAKRESQQIIISIEDDGPGIPLQVRESVLSRGKRLDETVEGQGIGMSVVKEILEAYHATIDIGESALGGASIRLAFKR